MSSRTRERLSNIPPCFGRRKSGIPRISLQRHLQLEGLDERVVLTITAEFTDASSSFNERDGIQSAKVTLTKDSTDTIPIQGIRLDVTCKELPSGNCNDLTLNNSALTVFPSDFQGDIAERFVDFTIDNDVVFEGLEQFELELVPSLGPPPQVVLGPNGKHVITLLDNESVNISILESAVEATEGVTAGGQVTLRLLIAADPAVGLTPSLGIDLEVNMDGDEDGDGEDDYDAPAVTFPAGTLTNTLEVFNVSAIDDDIFETLAETHPNQQLKLSAPNDAVTLGRTDVTIRDNESVQLELTGGIADVLEGQVSNDVSVKLQILSGTGPILQPNPQGRLAVPITAGLPIHEDFGSSVTFVSGDLTDTERPLEVLGIDDLFLEALTEIFDQQTLELPIPDNRVRLIGSADVHVTDNEAGQIRVVEDSVQAVESQPPATLELELEITGTGQGPSSISIPLPVNLLGNSDYSASGVTFPVGDPSGTKRSLEVTAIDDALFEVLIELFPQEVLQLQTTDTRIGLDSVEIRIRDNELIQVDILEDEVLVGEGQGASFVTVEFNVVGSGNGTPSLTIQFPPVSLAGNGEYGSDVVVFPIGSLSKATQSLAVFALEDLVDEGQVEQNYADEPLLLRQTNEPILPDRVRLDRVDVRVRNDDFTPPVLPGRFVIAVVAGPPIRPLPVPISRPLQVIFPAVQRPLPSYSVRETRGLGLSDHFFPWLEDHHLESEVTRAELSVPRSTVADLLPKALGSALGGNGENASLVSDHVLELLATSARRTLLRRNNQTDHSSTILAADVEQSKGTVLKPSVEIEKDGTPMVDPGRSRRIPNDTAPPE